MAELDELKLRISQLSDEQLMQMVAVDAQEYRKEAIDYATAELESRGIDIANPRAELIEGEVVEDAEATASLDAHGLVCLTCGGPARPGILVAEKELTIVFQDNREERFVKVNACSRCGQISLNVDYEDEVRP